MILVWRCFAIQRKVILFWDKRWAWYQSVSKSFSDHEFVSWLLYTTRGSFCVYSYIWLNMPMGWKENSHTFQTSAPMCCMYYKCMLSVSRTSQSPPAKVDLHRPHTSGACVGIPLYWWVWHLRPIKICSN